MILTERSMRSLSWGDRSSSPSTCFSTVAMRLTTLLLRLSMACCFSWREESGRLFLVGGSGLAPGVAAAPSTAASGGVLGISGKGAPGRGSHRSLRARLWIVRCGTPKAAPMAPSGWLVVS